jgi:hypothetical protein
MKCSPSKRNRTLVGVVNGVKRGVGNGALKSTDERVETLLSHPSSSYISIGY